MREQYLIIIISIAVIGLIIYVYFSNTRHKRKINLALCKTDNFDPSETYYSRNFETSISIDKLKNKVCFIDKKYNSLQYSFKDLIESEVLTDGLTYTKQSTRRKIGRSLRVGAVGQLAVAVDGRLSKRNKTRTNIDNIDINVTVNDLDNPVFEVSFLTQQFKKGGTIIEKEALIEAQYWHGLISALIKKADFEDAPDEEVIGTRKAKNILSVPGETNKLIASKEKGAVAQEEFELQK